ncbi:hypothetical protein CHCC14821_1634 [Bacillus paralicheniformis]|uniref:DUF6731 family protein n=1 Tax=Bacillus paralicheniformis TaxID=1648923 RepID=UPI0011A2780E|nr:DUF6731 family protein [Bacillus paralicheniformis]TWM30086.1 hypothetical protein CHCC14821_1634 [Bacillus paralicheniformis]
MYKKIKFDYFKVYARSYDQEKEVMEEKLCDLGKVIEEAQQIDVAKRVFSTGTDLARLQNIVSNDNKWEMHFIRIRKVDFPLKAHDNGHIGYFDDLDEAEGFGEELSALYDPSNTVIMLRRNKHSLSPSSIANFFTSLINEVGLTVIFKPLIHPDSLKLLKKDHLIRSAEIAVADVKNASEKTKKSLGSIISKPEEINEPVYINFKIALAQKGSRKQSRIPIYEDIMNVATDPNADKIDIKYKEDEDAKVEQVDLIENRLFDFHTFTKADINPESRNILHQTIIQRMHLLYRKRIDEINNIYE